MGKNLSRSNNLPHRTTVFGQARVDNTSISRHQRALVATLALHHRDGATITTISDAIWGNQIPHTATASIQNQISRLRTTFGEDLINTERNRYYLSSDNDVGNFEATITKSLRFQPSDETAQALSAALLLWVGRPYEDIEDNSRAMAEVARLEHLRGLAVEHLAIGRMLTDQFAQAIAELSERTADIPFHERAWELLMIAMYMSDRRIEALAAYARFENLVRVEFAARPSNALKRLRRIIAAGDSVDLRAVLSIPHDDSHAVQPLRSLVSA